MNDNEKYIEEFIKDIPFDAPEGKHLDTLKKQLLSAYPKHRLQPAAQTVGVWRIIMKGRISKLAAAAVIIFAVFMTLNFFDKKSGILWAEVVKRLEDIRTVVYKIEGDIESMPGTPEGYTTHVTQDVTLSYEQGAVRIDSSIQLPRGTMKSHTYILFEDSVIITVMPARKKYMEVTISDEKMKKMGEEKGDPVTLLKAMLEHEYTDLGRRTIDGVAAWGIEVSDPKLGAKMGSFISGGMFDETTVQLWVDEKRKLPIRINATGSSKDGRASMEMVYDNFQWDIEIEPAMLKPEIPDDYELITQGKWETGNEGEEIIEVLRLFVEYADGKYPASLKTMTVAKAIAPALKKKFPSGSPDPSKELLDRFIKVDRVGLMYTTLEKDGKDPAYYGDKVTAEFGEAVLFRWKIDNDTYRVVFGDLRTKDVSAEELMELESAPLNSKPNAIKPQPADGKTVGTSLEHLQLAWIPGAYVTEHLVYFGTDRQELTLLAEVTEPRLSELPVLERENVYYWRVDQVQPDGSILTGDTWSFSSGRLVGYWKLDEGKGNSTFDSSGNNGDGTLTNMDLDQWTEDGLYFDGIDDCVSTPALNLYSNTVTITAWLKRDGQQAEHETGLVMCRSDKTGAGLCLGHKGAKWEPNHCLAYNWNNNTKAWLWTTDLFLPDNEWVFAALVLEPDKATLYLGQDGELRSAVNHTPHRMEEFDGELRIGDDNHFDPPGMKRHFKGSIKNVQIYDYSLSSSEIETVFQGP